MIARLCGGILLVAGLLAADPRTVIRLDGEWRFQRGEVEGASSAAFDDSRWQHVTVPHTWNTDNDPPEAGYYRGPGWYRKEFTAPSNWKAQRVFVRFEAASLVARVYLNGKELGEHKGGFAAFCYELTAYLKPGGNMLAVRVDNSRREDVAPLGGDFTIFGGLYRPVSLIVTGQVNITPLDYASPGVFLRQANVSAGRAEVEATTEVSNGSRLPRNVAVKITVQDAEGNEILISRQRAPLPARQTRAVAQRFAIDNPHLWNGVADPYLYTVHVELTEGGRVLDSVEQPMGLRYFRFDPERGFMLNGNPRPLHGVNRHQDWAGLGWAITEKEQDTDLRFMLEMGVNAVRLAHYQHNDYFYRLCDRTGLLVWSELAMVNEVRGTEAFRTNVRQQLIEMIRQNLNHPSIAMWSLYNELSPRNQYSPAAMVEELKRVAKQEDPSRPTTGALSIDGIEKLPELARTTELLALNVYPGWYIETPDAMGAILDKWNAFYGSKGIILSEYGAGASIRQHQQDFAGRNGRAPNDWHPEEWQSVVHEANYAALKTRPFVPASFLWAMFDFASAGRKEGDTSGINDKGLVTRDRKVRKDAFYFYKANWSRQPMVYITSRRDSDRTSAETAVKVYSNCARVMLSVNGESYGAGEDNGNGVFTWNGVRLKEGENRIEVEAASERGILKDACTWTYRPK